MEEINENLFGEERGVESRNRIVQNNEEKCHQQINEFRIEKTGKKCMEYFVGNKNSVLNCYVINIWQGMMNIFLANEEGT